MEECEGWREGGERGGGREGGRERGSEGDRDIQRETDRHTFFSCGKLSNQETEVVRVKGVWGDVTVE